MSSAEHLGEQAIERLNANNSELLQLAEPGAQAAWVQMQIEQGWSEDWARSTDTLVCHAAAPHPANQAQGPGAFTADQLAELRRLSWEVDDHDDYAMRQFALPDEVAGGAAIREAAALLVLTLSRVYAESHELAWVEPPSREQRAAILAQILAMEAVDELT